MSAAGWAWRALSRVRRELRRPVDWREVDVPRAPRSRGRRLVVAVLRARRATCLERSLVLQRWDADHGRRVAIVVGVTHRPFRAHAWLEGEGVPADLVEFQRRSG